MNGIKRISSIRRTSFSSFSDHSSLLSYISSLSRGSVSSGAVPWVIVTDDVLDGFVSSRTESLIDTVSGLLLVSAMMCLDQEQKKVSLWWWRKNNKDSLLYLHEQDGVILAILDQCYRVTIISHLLCIIEIEMGLVSLCKLCYTMPWCHSDPTSARSLVFPRMPDCTIFRQYCSTMLIRYTNPNITINKVKSKVMSRSYHKWRKTAVFIAMVAQLNSGIFASTDQNDVQWAVFSCFYRGV